MGELGKLGASDPPANLQYQIVEQQGPNAKVKVSGFAPGYDEILNSRLYLMTREGGQWYWCGLDYDLGLPFP